MLGSDQIIRGVFAGGYMSPGISKTSIDFVTIATTGNATDFGDLTKVVVEMGAGSTSDSHGGLAE